MSDPTARLAPKPIYYPEAGLRLELSMFSGWFNSDVKYSPKFDPFVSGITAEQAREAAHLLNQLAEFLDAQKKRC